MIWVHFCVYTGPGPGRTFQQMRQYSQKKPQPTNQPTKQKNTKKWGEGRVLKGDEKRGKIENDVFFC